MVSGNSHQKSLSEMVQDPISSLILIQLQANQEKCYPAEAKPTSEWSSHRRLHNISWKLEER